jgi:type IV secretion system protein VirB11
MTPHSAGTPCETTPPPSSALALTLRALTPLLETPGLTDLCINRPGEAFLDTSAGWQRLAAPFADADWCLRLAKLIAHATHQRITPEAPLLSATLPSGERVQIVIPPASPSAVFAVRKPSTVQWTLEGLTEAGLFTHTRTVENGTQDQCEQALIAHLRAGQYSEFLREAVRARKNIVISGATGSGKTTLMKALVQEIDERERLITIEDALELTLDRHPNSVRLLYSKDNQGLAKVTPKQLIECTLRLRPSRVLLAELRAEEAFEYLLATAAHPGSVTSVHASSAPLAFEQLSLLVKRSPGGAELGREDILNLLHLLVHVVVQMGSDRRVREIWYAPLEQAPRRPRTTPCARV